MLSTSVAPWRCISRRPSVFRCKQRMTLRMVHTAPNETFSRFPPDVRNLAGKLEDARSKNYQIPPLTASIPELSQETGYQISSAIRALRYERNKDVVVGRKIGFTNMSIWPEYNVDRSNWSFMYRSSVLDLVEDESTGSKPAVAEISEFSNLEPKIEPEIVLGLKATVSSDMSDDQILSCVEWVAHGFEIVVSVYPGWKFTAADTTAAFALHGELLLGSKTYLRSASTSGSDLLGQLQRFRIKLIRNGCVADEGTGSNVLGSPIKALRHLAELLERDEVNLQLKAGEIVTTGTLTRALSISDGDRWQTEIEGLDVQPLDVQFRMEK